VAVQVSYARFANAMARASYRQALDEGECHYEDCDREFCDCLDRAEHEEIKS
jgi:hypothetical protein